MTAGMPHWVMSATQPTRPRDIPEKKGLTFLFQGDSITDGNRTRDNDWNHIMGHGYAYLIASRLWFDYPEREWMFYNRGISGNRVKDLDARWQEDTLVLKPDVVSILVGVNDVIATLRNWDPQPMDQVELIFRRILDKTRNALPDTRIVLCEPFSLPLGWALQKPDVWKTEIRKYQEMVRSLAKEYSAIFVGLQRPFEDACQLAPPSYWIWDGVHPMPAGHELIARLWIRKVDSELDMFSS